MNENEKQNQIYKYKELTVTRGEEVGCREWAERVKRSRGPGFQLREEEVTG